MRSAASPPIQALVQLLQTGQFQLLVKQAGECTGRWPASAAIWHLLALGHLSLGNPVNAIGPLRKASKLSPDDPQIHDHLGAALLQTGKKHDALKVFEHLARLTPASPQAHINVASLANDLCEWRTAERHCMQALSAAPNSAEATFNFARSKRGIGKTAEAIANFMRAAELAPHAAIAQNDIGVQLLDIGAIEYAETCLRRAIQLAPEHALAYVNLGKLLGLKGEIDAAEDALNKAIALDPCLAEAYSNLGGLQNTQNHFTQCESTCRQALSINPKLIEAKVNLANALVGQRSFEEAETHLREVLRDTPKHLDAMSNLANLLLDTKRHREAEQYYRQISGDHGFARAQAFLCAGHRCDWRQRDGDLHAIRELLKHDDSYLGAFGLLAIPGDDAPSLQRRAGRLAALREAGSCLSSTPMVSSAHHPNHDRLHVGYISADLHDHATMHLLAGVLQSHDPTRFRIHLYSLGPDTDDAYRAIAKKYCEKFVDVRRLSDREAAQAIADDQIDILVDLKGFTAGMRLGICALRPAPVIVSWLGYPGTLGHERLADYIVGDPIVTPPSSAGDFSETLALMPHCYQPNDRNRKIGAPITRNEAGLPDEALVFCSFNQSYKILPEVFDSWCKILAAVPNSVLWLLDQGEDAASNLRSISRQRGINPDRLVFAPRRPLDQHLARLQLADLALDTYPYGSHTTGSDALWVGVPLLARSGNTFASRVSASLLSAVGMPELITDNWDDYEKCAIKLAFDKNYLAALRQRLIAHRDRAPLFDTLRFTRNWERLLQEIWTQHAKGVQQPIVLTES